MEGRKEPTTDEEMCIVILLIHGYRLEKGIRIKKYNFMLLVHETYPNKSAAFLQIPSWLSVDGGGRGGS